MREATGAFRVRRNVCERLLAAHLGEASLRVLALAVAGGAALVSTSAQAQTRPDCTVAANDCVYAINGETIVTASTSQSVVLNPATTTTNNVSAYRTEVIAKINGGIPLYDTTFALPFSDPAVQTGVTQARAAITTAGGPGVLITGPTLTSRSTTTSSSSVTTYSFDHSTDTPGVTTYNGGRLSINQFTINQANGAVSYNGSVIGIVATSVPKANQPGGPFSYIVLTALDGTPITMLTPDFIQGQRTVCDVSSLPGTTKPTCATGNGTGVYLPGGQTSINVNTDTAYYINQSTVTTNTTTLFEQWTLFGTVQAFGMVHTAVQSGALDANSRFLRRLGDEAGRGDQRPVRIWLEGYGVWSREKAQGGISDDNRNLYGIAGGLSARVKPNFTLGFGIDHGNTGISLDSAFAESGKIDLTQIGVNAGYTSGPWFANLAGTYGFGNADTSHAIGGVSTASYRIRTWGTLAETGYRFDVGGFNITPSLGLDYTNMRSDSFTETGGLALTANGYSTDRTRIWAGLNVGQHLGKFDWSVYGRLVDVVAGDERLLPVTFYGNAMTVTGVSEARIGGDAGARVSYKFAPSAELFVRYDGRFRDGFTAHAATAGLKVSF